MMSDLELQSRLTAILESIGEIRREMWPSGSIRRVQLMGKLHRSEAALKEAIEALEKAEVPLWLDRSGPQSAA